MTYRILLAFGTRPEAIKMAPVAQALGQSGRVEVITCVTGQHRQMLDQVLQLFRIRPDYDLDVMRPSQTLTSLTCGILDGMVEVLREARPDLVLVHGDTTTTLAAAMASCYSRIPVGHVEAGLRTGDQLSPWPEEINRRMTDSISTLWFAPTHLARRNLLSEGADPARVFVTGNTVIDALMSVVAQLRADPMLRSRISAQLPAIGRGRRLILVTGHRRESFGTKFLSFCNALRRIAQSRDDVEIIYPVHLNPQVREPVFHVLGNVPRVHLIEPLEYMAFTHLMMEAHLIVTDSGGIQEEAPALGKPVLVTRDTTERPEAIEAGTARLVGTVEEDIVVAVRELLDDPVLYARFARARNPYGDGRAAQRIATAIESFRGGGCDLPEPEPATVDLPIPAFLGGEPASAQQMARV